MRTSGPGSWSAIGLAAAVLAAPLLVACGSDEQAELRAGVVREAGDPVDRVALPDLSRGGEPFALRAAEGQHLLVFFGFTNCPDICPTTLSDVYRALEALGDDADRVRFAMVTVDPANDLAVLAPYVQQFVPDGHALGTDDEALLTAVAEPFGVTFDVTIDGDRYIVDHTPDLFLVDDRGRVVVSWPFGVPAADLAADLQLVAAGDIDK